MTDTPSVSTAPSVAKTTPSVPPTPSVAKTTPKKSNATLIIIIVIVLVLLLMCCGCSGFLLLGTSRLSGKVQDKVNDAVGRDLFDNAIEETVEESLEDSFGGDSDVDFDDDQVTWDSEDSTGSFGEGTEWPDDLPVDLPEFTYGNITGVVSYQDTETPSWSMTFDESPAGSADLYKSDVTGSGWTVSDSYEYETTTIFTADKEGWTVTCSCTSEDGTCFVMLAESY